MQIECIAVQTTLQERADLLGDPLDPGEHRQTDQAWPAGSNSEVARYADVDHFRREEWWLTPADLKPDVHSAESGERSRMHEWVLQALPAGVHDADIGDDAPAVELREERGAHWTVANTPSGDDDCIEIGGQPWAAVDQRHDGAAFEREHLAEGRGPHQQLALGRPGPSKVLGRAGFARAFVTSALPARSASEKREA